MAVIVALGSNIYKHFGKKQCFNLSTLSTDREILIV